MHVTLSIQLSGQRQQTICASTTLSRSQWGWGFQLNPVCMSVALHPSDLTHPQVITWQLCFSLSPTVLNEGATTFLSNRVSEPFWSGPYRGTKDLLPQLQKLSQSHANPPPIKSHECANWYNHIALLGTHGVVILQWIRHLILLFSFVYLHYRNLPIVWLISRSASHASFFYGTTKYGCVH